MHYVLSGDAVCVITCIWLRAGAGTSERTWPRPRKNEIAPRRTSVNAESETSGRLRSRTPWRRTVGPEERETS